MLAFVSSALIKDPTAMHYLQVFSTVDPSLSVTWKAKDGDHVTSGTKFGTVKGSARSILIAERIALNFTQRMSGIATATAAMVEQIKAGACFSQLTDLHCNNLREICCTVLCKSRVRTPSVYLLPTVSLVCCWTTSTQRLAMVLSGTACMAPVFTELCRTARSYLRYCLHATHCLCGQCSSS